MDMTTYLLMRNRWGGGIIPSGTISISANGSYNVEAFASAEVLVSGGGEDVTAVLDRTISVLENNTTEIGFNAMFACQNLLEVSLPEVTHISNGAFTNCYSLSKVYAPNLLSIGHSPVVYPDVGTGAFSYCSALTSIDFPKLSYMYGGAFNSCVNLRQVNMPVLSSIGVGAFANCYSLESAYFPEVTFISSGAFNHCSSLTTAIFPKAVIVGDNPNYGGVFMQCSNLNLISFPLAETIGAYAFSQCIKLTSASFPSLKMIGFQAFQSCYHLLSLYLLGSSCCTLAAVNAFTSTPILNYTTSTGGVYGSIFVPASLYNSYISATNWATFSARFVSMTDEEIAALNT